MENKRLCNVAEPKLPSDVASIQSVRNIIHQHVPKIQGNNEMILALQSFYQNQKEADHQDIKMLKELITKNSSMISNLDAQLNTLEQRFNSFHNESKS